MKMMIYEKLKIIFRSIVGTKEEIDERLKQFSSLGIEKKRDDILKKNKLVLIIVILVLTLFFIKEVKVYYENNKLLESINKNQEISRDEYEDNQLSLKVFTRQKGRKELKEENIDVKVRSVSYLNKKDNEKNKDVFGKEDLNEDSREIKNLFRNAEDNNEKVVKLPKKLNDGRKLVWTATNDFTGILILPVAMIVILLLKKYRFAEISKLEREVVKSIKRELPNFINKLVLLLSTGIIFERAFKIAVEDRIEMIEEKNYFYKELINIGNIHKNSKEDIIELLYDFAKRSRVRDLVRVVNIVWDNVSKGDRLADKLQLESELLWFSQKKDMEERGRLSEGKLIMPLIVMLIILVIITVAPAMIDI